MTTIVYCRETQIMAADTQMTQGSRKRTVSKIVRLPDGGLCAGAGTVSGIVKLVRWVQSGFKPEATPRLTRSDNDACVLLVRPDGTVWEIDKSLDPLPVEDEYPALGSGSDFAVGAMARGASAEEAVEVACEYDLHSGGSVDTEALYNSQHPRPTRKAHKRAKS